MVYFAKRLAVAVGCLLLIPAGAHAVPAAVAGERAPLNVLLAGIDPRGSHTRPLADSIVVAHVPADRRAVYLFSIPRDLVVEIPEFAASGTPAQRAKINAAMGLGSQTGPGTYDAAQGFDLLSRTVGRVTGIPRFDAGAVINFGGFTKMVDTMGGIRMVIDQDVVSEHRKPDGSPRDRLPECRGHNNCLRPYTGEQKTYHRSDQPVRLKGWEALDYARQRYGLPRSDYDRQRHHRQFLEAMAKQLSVGGIADVGRLLDVVGAVGDSLVIAGGGQSIVRLAVELRTLDVGDLTTVNLPGEALFSDGRYLGEQYTAPEVREFFTAVTEDRVAQFLADHPGYADGETSANGS